MQIRMNQQPLHRQQDSVASFLSLRWVVDPVRFRPLDDDILMPVFAVLSKQCEFFPLPDIVWQEFVATAW